MKIMKLYFPLLKRQEYLTFSEVNLKKIMFLHFYLQPCPYHQYKR